MAMSTLMEIPKAIHFNGNPRTDLFPSLCLSKSYPGDLRKAKKEAKLTEDGAKIVTNRPQNAQI